MSDTQPLVVLLTLLCIVFTTYIYFLPTFIAYRRRARWRGWILLFNTFAAAAIILWFALLFWACSARSRSNRPVISRNPKDIFSRRLAVRPPR